MLASRGAFPCPAPAGVSPDGWSSVPGHGAASPGLRALAVAVSGAMQRTAGGPGAGGLGALDVSMTAATHQAATSSLDGGNGLSAGGSPSGPRIPQPAIDSPSADYEPPDDDTRDALDLMRAAQAGDPQAFGAIYDRYVDTVYRFVAYRVRQQQLAEDLTSETFLRALRAIDQFSWQGRDPGAWLVTIARNLVTDHFKSARSRLEHTSEDPTLGQPEPVQAGPEDAVMAGLTADVLLDAVAKLGTEQQECIVLRFLQGMSVAETAQALNKRPDAVKALQYRAVKSLAKLVPAELAS